MKHVSPIVLRGTFKSARRPSEKGTLMPGAELREETAPQDQVHAVGAADDIANAFWIGTGGLLTAQVRYKDRDYHVGIERCPASSRTRKPCRSDAEISWWVWEVQGDGVAIGEGRAMTLERAFSEAFGALTNVEISWQDEFDRLDPLCPLTTREDVELLLTTAPTDHWRGYMKAVRDLRIQHLAATGRF